MLMSDLIEGEVMLSLTVCYDGLGLDVFIFNATSPGLQGMAIFPFSKGNRRLPSAETVGFKI